MASDLHALVAQAARENGLDPAFVARLVLAESNWNPSAVSPKGAIGLMQLMPATGADYGATNLTDPQENIRAGVAHLKRLSDKYHGDQVKIAAAYNAGEGRVDKAGGVPHIAETEKYVGKVATPEGFTPIPDGFTPEGFTPLGKEAAAAPSLWERIKAHPVSTLSEALPMAGGAIGGVVGGIPGAALGAMGGEGFKKIAQDGLEAVKSIPQVVRNLADPVSRAATVQGFAQGAGEGAKGALTQGVINGALEGGGQLLGAGMKAAAPRLYQSALKPTWQMLKTAPAVAGGATGAAVGATTGYETGGLKGAAAGLVGGGVTGAAIGAMSRTPPAFVKTLLAEGVPVTERGIKMVEELLQPLQKTQGEMITKAVAEHPEGVSPFKITSRLGQTAERFGNQNNPVKALDKIGKVGNEFLEQHGGEAIPYDKLQSLKQGTSKMLRGKYGKLGGAKDEAEKALVRAQKEEIEAAAPGISEVNAKIGSLSAGKRALERRVGMEGNKDVAGISVLAKGPKAFLASLMDRNPAFKSMVATGMWRNADRVGTYSPDVLRGLAALRQIASGRGGDEPTEREQ